MALRDRANREVKKAQRAVKKAEGTEGGRDDRAAQERLRVARQNRRDVRTSTREVRQARRARSAAAETAGRRDDRAARRQVQNARENRQAVRQRVRNPKKQMGDVLSDRVLARQYEMAWGTISGDPELLALFRRATNTVEGQWTPQRFTAELQNTNWYQSHSEWWRRAYQQETAGGADWDEQMTVARDLVQRSATEWGVEVDPAMLDTLARDYLYNGWGEQGREGVFRTELANRFGVDIGAGEAGDATSQWRAIAEANGMQYSEGLYESWAKSVATGLSTVEDFERQIREDAASAFPLYRDKIIAGENVSDLASGYVNMMSRVLEVDPTSVSLYDPHIKEAISGVDEAGSPRAMGMWDFEKRLRSDPRWGYTKNAREEASSFVTSMLRNFGVIGR